MLCQTISWIFLLFPGGPESLLILAACKQLNDFSTHPSTNAAHSFCAVKDIVKHVSDVATIAQLAGIHRVSGSSILGGILNRNQESSDSARAFTLCEKVGRLNFQ